MGDMVSLIIPTHNRSASLKRMLESLGKQSYPKENFEVIIVADGCKDDTLEIVRNHKCSFLLVLSELPGLGAASARNKGASLAHGKWLIFADDDMELSNDFIAEHINAHTTENSVVIGYSPFYSEQASTIMKMNLREWWEEKFQAMRKKGHRFKYDDLTSGNFSISSVLFKTVNGFDTALLCREDYELGFRLIKADAAFCFAYEAKALHRDEVTDLQRSLQRKKTEGMADMQIKRKHPDFINKEAIYYLSQRSFSKSILLKAIHVAPALCDSTAYVATFAMRYFEKFKMRSRWLRINYLLHQYWYLRGLMQVVSSSRECYQMIQHRENTIAADEKQVIDLKEGLHKAEKKLDNNRTLELEIRYGQKLIGYVPYEPGTEPIKGIHLRCLLKNKFSDELYKALTGDTPIIAVK